MAKLLLILGFAVAVSTLGFAAANADARSSQQSAPIGTGLRGGLGL